jgi:hypothetical protein
MDNEPEKKMLNLEKTYLNKKLSQEGIPRFLASDVEFGKCLGQVCLASRFHSF